MFLYTPFSPRTRNDTLSRVSTDAGGHLYVQTLMGAIVLMNKYTHTKILSMSSGKGLGGIDQNP